MYCKWLKMLLYFLLKCVQLFFHPQVKPQSGISDCESNALKSRHNWTVNGHLSLTKTRPSTTDVTREANMDQSPCKSAVTESFNGENVSDKDNKRTVQPTENQANTREKFDLTWDLPDDALEEISRFHVFVQSLKNQAWHFLGHTPICSYSCYLGNGTKDFDLNRFKLDAVLVNEDSIVEINVTIRK